MPRSLSETYRAAFVTGASTGLGRAFSEMLLGEGLQVWGTSRDVARLTSLGDRSSGQFHPVALDLGDADAAERAFLAANRKAGGFDVVINNAGYSVFGEFGATDFSVWREQLEAMLVNTAHLAHTAVRTLQADGPGARRVALVNVSSLAAEFPLPYQSAYNMCKAGLTALSESLMVECQGTNIIILDVRPGDYRTDFESSIRRMSSSPGTRVARAWTAFGRMMRSGPAPEHAAAALRRALARGRSGTVRTGRLFQAVIAPFISRFGSLPVKRRVQARYFDL